MHKNFLSIALGWLQEFRGVAKANEPQNQFHRSEEQQRNALANEQISGLARVVRANAQAAFENVALWHERDISHSSVERVIFPDSTILADYLLGRLERWLRVS